MDKYGKYSIFYRPPDTGLQYHLEDIKPSTDTYRRKFLGWEYNEEVFAETNSRRHVRWLAEQYQRKHPNDSIEIYEYESYKGSKTRFWQGRLIWRDGAWV